MINSIMKNSEIKALSTNDIKERIEIEQNNLQKLKFAHAISPIENPMKIKWTRRLVARLNTELRKRELEKA